MAGKAEQTDAVPGGGAAARNDPRKAENTTLIRHYHSLHSAFVAVSSLGSDFCVFNPSDSRKKETFHTRNEVFHRA